MTTTMPTAPCDLPAVVALEARFPEWEGWVIKPYIGERTWCARRRDDHRHVLNAGSAAELAGLIEADTGDEPAIAGLEAVYPAWECWSVPQVTGGATWHARPRVGHRRMLTAGSAAGLAELIARAEAGT
jgi:hypothetical protein